MFFIWVCFISNWSWLICGRSTCSFSDHQMMFRDCYTLLSSLSRFPCALSASACSVLPPLCFGTSAWFELERGAVAMKNVLTLFSFSHVIKVFLFTHNKWFVLASFLVCDHTLLSILVLCEGLFNDFYVFIPSLLQTLCLTGKQWQTAGFFSAPLRVGKASHSRYGAGNSMKFGKKQKWTVCKVSRVQSSPSRRQKWSVRVWHLRRDCLLQR